MSEDAAGGNASDAEAAPLKGISIDVEKFLESSLKIRLPLMTEDGDFVRPARQKKEKGSMKKKKMTAMGEQATSTIKDKAVELHGTIKDKAAAVKAQVEQTKRDCIPGGLGLPKSSPTVLAKKYAVDIATNAIYVVGALIAAAMGPTQSTVKAEEMKSKLEGEENKLLEHWVIGMGCISGIVVMVKNVRYIVNFLFVVIDTIEGKVNEAIDFLQKELQEDISEMLDDGMDSGAMGTFAKKGAVQSCVKVLGKSIDDAQKKLDGKVFTLLPWAVSTKRNLIVVLSSPCLAIIMVTYVVNLATSPSYGRRLLAASSMASSIEQMKPMVVNVMLNALIAFLSSDPVVRFVSNNAIRKIENAVNVFILSSARESIPGGVDGLQNVLDMGSSGATADMRSCGESCAGRQGCTLS